MDKDIVIAIDFLKEVLESVRVVDMHALRLVCGRLAADAARVFRNTFYLFYPRIKVGNAAKCDEHRQDNVKNYACSGFSVETNGIVQS